MATSKAKFASNNLLYYDASQLDKVQAKLQQSLPLISAIGVNSLRHQLNDVFNDHRFILQIGDCAERFSESEREITHLKCKQLIHVKSLIEYLIKKPVIAIGRIAGQYAKPRSIPKEEVDGRLLYSYYGDMINSESLVQSRNPDPCRILTAYHSSKKILSHISEINERIFTSHECYLLEYETPLTRVYQDRRYNLSTHLPWLGMRNIQSSKHIDYLSAIENPIAIKVSYKTSLPTIISVIKRLNPLNLQGKVILVLRLGVDNVKDSLPAMINEMQQHKINVIWMSDPLHGNTKTDEHAKKYRLLGDAINESIQVAEILHSHGTHLGGLHLEATYKDNVLECVSTPDELTRARAYDSALDPRLNNRQCITYVDQVINKIVSLQKSSRSAMR